MSAGSRVWPAGGAAVCQMLEILGHNVGVSLSIPGGLFEIAFGVLLIAKGFPAQQSHDYEDRPATSGLP
jgi:hypothetical protein